jgi:hypothetical protein
VTINWNTTPSEFVPVDTPKPINPTIPTIPINPEPLPQQSEKKGSNIIGIVGLTISGIGLAGLGAYTAYKNKSLESGIISEKEFDDPLILSERPDQGELERKEQEEENFEFDINNLEEE